MTDTEKRTAASVIAALDAIGPGLNPWPTSCNGIIAAIDAMAIDASQKERFQHAFRMAEQQHLLIENHGYASAEQMRADLQRRVATIYPR